MIAKKFFWVMILYSCLAHSREYLLSDLVDLAKKYSGNIAPDNRDFFNPDFTSYFASYRPSFLTKITRFFGINRDPLPIDDIFNLLKEVVETQKSRGRLGDYIVGTQLDIDQKIIVFGNIQGAFHSLVRDLEELHRQNIIDEHLTVIDPSCYIIFNGPALCRSAEPLQTLFVILILLKQNPDKVIYLESDFEKDQLWRNYGFAQQIDAAYGEYKHDFFSLFSTLVEVMPFAFYGNYAESPEKLLKITALKSLEYEGVENQTSDFFYNLKKNELHFRSLNKQDKSEKPVHVNVLIQGFVPTLLERTLKPLMFLEPIQMASVWRVFSSPTYAFQKMYNFDDDAFASLVCGKELNSSIIELHSRKVSSLAPFSVTESYKINTGIPARATQENLNRMKETIKIASTLDLSETNYAIGNCARLGISLALNRVNASDALGGKEVQAYIYEDFYNPYIASQNYNLLKNDAAVTTFLLSIGTTALLVAENDIKAGNIISAFPIIGVADYRKEDLKGVVNFTPPYELEVEALINCLVKTRRLKSFGFFYQDDDYGKGALRKAKEVLKVFGIENCVEIPYDPNSSNFEKQCEILKNQKVQALGFFSTSFATQAFLRQLGVFNIATTQLFALAFVGDNIFESFIKNELGLSCIYSRVVPNPQKSMLPIVQEYRSMMDEKKKEYDSFSLLGFICTSILCDIMQKVSGPITHTALIEQFEAIKNYNYKGLMLNFDPQDRQISKRVWLDFQDGQDWQEVV